MPSLSNSPSSLGRNNVHVVLNVKHQAWRASSAAAPITERDVHACCSVLGKEVPAEWTLNRSGMCALNQRLRSAITAETLGVSKSAAACNPKAFIQGDKGGQSQSH